MNCVYKTPLCSPPPSSRPTSLDDRHDSDEEYDRDPRDFDMGPNKFEDLNSGLQQQHQPANHRYGLDDGEEKDMEVKI